MLSSLRKCPLFPRAEATKFAVVLVSSAALAGCSADISRFDLGYSDGARAQSENSSSGTTGRSASSNYGSAGYDRPAYRTSEVSRSQLPPTPQEGMTTAAIHPQQAPSYGGGDAYSPSGQQSYTGAQGYNAAPSYGSARRAPQYGASQGGSSPSYDGSQYGNAGASSASGTVPPIASRGGAAGGETIQVRPGDTLYSLSRQHGVSVNDLKSANGLASNNLQPGQQLHLPSGSRPRYATETARPPRESHDTVAQSAPSHHSADTPSDWNRSYTVRPGDSMYSIARQNGVKLAELERHNGIADSRKVKPGTVLKLPGEAHQQVADASPVPAPQTSAPAVTAAPEQTPAPDRGVVRLGEQPSAQAAPSTPQTPTMLNGTGLAGPGGPERVAKAETNSASDAVSPSSTQNSTSVAGFSKLRWPVSGKVITGFGPRPDGTHNDGVNLAVPMGTDVHAAENGVVAYAGDELKGYGNLVLVRHDNGWVTAYAHADEILVKRGDQIKRGQVIAKAGRTGQVDQPQVHFELRQGQKPVDPSPFMERL